MKKNALNGWLVAILASASVVALLQACGDDEETGSTTTTSTTTTSNASTGTGTNCSSVGADPACETCVTMSCPDEALACANLSMCDASGVATSGCLALVTCAAEKCGGADMSCVLAMCADEVSGAGSDGIAAAQDLGDCVVAQCDAVCNQGTGGGGGAGGGG